MIDGSESISPSKGRSPHGERGLKFLIFQTALFMCKSLSSRRAWIEIYTIGTTLDVVLSRSPHGERGLKLQVPRPPPLLSHSRSPHGERGLKYDIWKFIYDNNIVALLTESVDWNKSWKYKYPWWCNVALLTESVDWNAREQKWIELITRRSPHGERGLKFSSNNNTLMILCRSPHGERGLKLYLLGLTSSSISSLSSRRAWIEMLLSNFKLSCG